VLETWSELRSGLPWLWRALPGLSRQGKAGNVHFFCQSVRGHACRGEKSKPLTAHPPWAGHDRAVVPLGRTLGDPVPPKGQDVVPLPGGHLPNRAQRGQILLPHQVSQRFKNRFAWTTLWAFHNSDRLSFRAPFPRKTWPVVSHAKVGRAHFDWPCQTPWYALRPPGCCHEPIDSHN